MTELPLWPFEPKGNSKTFGCRSRGSFNCLLGEFRESEWDRLEDYVERMDQYHLEHKPEKTSYPTTVTRSLVEEATGLPFEYEILPAFEEYQSDKKAYEVSSQDEALADLCLVLFNTNEFMYALLIMKTRPLRSHPQPSRFPIRPHP